VKYKQSGVHDNLRCRSQVLEATFYKCLASFVAFILRKFCARLLHVLLFVLDFHLTFTALRCLMSHRLVAEQWTAAANIWWD